MKDLKGTVIKFLPDGYAVAYMLEGEVRQVADGFVLEVPVTLYDEEWGWLDSGFIYLGLEQRYEDTVMGEVEHWLHGRARTAHATAQGT